MTTYAKRKLKYLRNENFNLLHYVEWDRIVTLSQHKRTEGYVIVSRLFIAVICVRQTSEKQPTYN